MPRCFVDRLRLEAEMHAQEMRTQRATVHEIYQIVSGGKGEPGDWHGAEPVREFADRLRAEVKAARNAALEEAAMVANRFTRFAGIDDYADAPKLIAAAIREMKDE